jgi:hypothetical protein
MAAPSLSPSGGASPLKKQPEWRPDTASNACLCCGTAFSLFCRRHHCRACGELVCGACSPYTELVAEFGYDGAVRVCKTCTANDAITASPGAPTSATSSEASNSDSEMEDDEDLLRSAIELIASHSSHKHSVLSYEYFVQSEAVSWLVDAGVVPNRRAGAALFTRLIDDDIVTMKPGSGSRRAFYVLSEDVVGARLSQYGRAMHAETNKCQNCSQSFLEKQSPAPGFCSIDCKTNAAFSQADAARIRRMGL